MNKFEICPKCGSASPGEGIRCACGYDLPPRVEGAASTAVPAMKPASGEGPIAGQLGGGIALLGLGAGILVSLYGAFFGPVALENLWAIALLVSIVPMAVIIAARFQEDDGIVAAAPRWVQQLRRGMLVTTRVTIVVWIVAFAAYFGLSRGEGRVREGFVFQKHEHYFLLGDGGQKTKSRPRGIGRSGPATPWLSTPWACFSS